MSVKTTGRKIVNRPASRTAERVLSEKTLGNGSVMRRAYIEQVLAFAAAASADLTTQLPAAARVLFAQMNWDVALVLVTAVKVGLGTAADPDRFALSGTVVTKNTKTNSVPLEAVGLNAAAVTMRVTAVDTNGAAAGTVTSGTVRARIVYEYVTSIGNA